MDNEPVKQSTGAWQAWLFITLLGPPLGALILSAIYSVVRLPDSNGDVVSILFRFPMFLAFISFCSYVVGSFQAILFGSYIALVLRKNKHLGWTNILLGASIIGCLSILALPILVKFYGHTDALVAGMIIGALLFCSFVSTLACCFFLAAFNIVQIHSTKFDPYRFRGVAKVAFGSWLIVLLIGAIFLSLRIR